MPHSFLGAGTSGDPYQVWNAEDLDHVRDFPSAEFKQMEDIEWDDANHWLPVPSFTGVFDGDKKKITGLHSWQDNAPSQLASEWGGLVHELTGLGMVRNVLIVGANFQGVLSQAHGAKTGGIVNVLTNGGVMNCGVYDSYIRGNYEIGGIVGFISLADMSVVAVVEECAVENTEIVGANTFDVDTPAEKTGGVVGHAYTQGSTINIRNCHVVASYIASWFSTTKGKLEHGGIVGLVESTEFKTVAITNCYFAGVMEGNSDMGGSWADYGPIVGKKSGDGYLTDTHVYYDEDLLGFVYAGSYGIAKSTAWFRDEVETIDVAFSSDYWGVDSTSKIANGYPYLLDTPYVEGMAGIGTDEDPYQIEDEFDLLYIDTLYENSFILVNDINCSEVWIGVLCILEGNFDGNFRTISGMTSMQTGSDTSKWHRGGLFSTIEPPTVIQNVIISDATIETYGSAIGREQGSSDWRDVGRHSSDGVQSLTPLSQVRIPLEV
jgi:hypothetical protein